MAGDYHINDDVITLIPDNIGNQNRMEAAVCLLSYKDYLINPENAYVKAEKMKKYLNLKAFTATNSSLDGKIFKSAYDNPTPKALPFWRENTARPYGDFVTLFLTESPLSPICVIFVKMSSIVKSAVLPNQFLPQKLISKADIAAVDLQKSVFAYQEENALGYELNLVLPLKEKLLRAPNSDSLTQALLPLSCKALLYF